MTRLLRFLIGTLACACAPAEIAVRFEGLVGGEPARCGATYSGVGASGTELELLDYRLYVHDLRLVTESGDEVELTLAQDGAWQREGVVLLDFEDGTAGCDSGTSGTNAVARGNAASSGPFRAIRFTLGVPAELNHADASTAAPPLHYTSMFWSWNGGYKFLRVEGRTGGQPDGFRVHVGSTGCEGDGRGNVTGCVQDNRAAIELPGFDPEASVVAVDLGALFEESDLDRDLGGNPGCMGSFDDPDCERIFHGLGLAFAGAPSTGQRLFSVR